MVRHEALQRRFMRFLWVYEFLVISACIGGGFLIASSQGGSAVLAAPLLLVGAAEMLRVPLAAMSVSLNGVGRALATVALAAIAVVSFEGLSLLFEVFLDNRSGAVMDATRISARADDALAMREKMASQAAEAVTAAKDRVASLNADIANQSQHPPQQPSVSASSCKARDGRTVTCSSDAVARETFRLAQAAHLSTLKALRADLAAAQETLDRATATAVPVDAERKTASDARQALADVKRLSPMHRLAASILGLDVASLSEGDFERVKRWGVLGLAGAFATLSMVASIAAHQPERSQVEGKLSRSLRALLARRRKRVVAIRRVEVPVERVVVRWLPASGMTSDRTGKRGLGPYEMPEGETAPLSSIIGGRRK